MYRKLDKEIVKHLRKNGPKPIWKMRGDLRRILGIDFELNEIYGRCVLLERIDQVKLIKDDKGVHVWHAAA